MKRLVISVAVASLAVAGAVVPGAVGKSNKRAKVYRATLRPVPVGDYGLLAQSRGKAQMVDGKKNNKISIHVRKLTPGVTYTWHIHKVAATVAHPCNAPSATDEGVPGWTYRKLKANSAGNANSKAKSKTFAADPDSKYYVDVHLPAADGHGLVFLCGVLHTKQHKAPKGKGHAKAPAKKHTGHGKH